MSILHPWTSSSYSSIIAPGPRPYPIEIPTLPIRASAEGWILKLVFQTAENYSNPVSMKPYSITIFMPLLFFVFLAFLPSSNSQSQACFSTCGKLPLKYPFGTGAGCGDPRFHPYVACTPDQQQLTFTTHTGCYTITSIDYDSHIIYVHDPSMSTCACTLPSRGFGLDWDAPFSFHDDTVFALLGCTTDSASGSSSVCDARGGPVCSLLSSCAAISRLSLPASTCCVYTPVDLGPAFDMDLQKLRCSSYSALYGFGGQETNPEAWKYGIAVKYKFSYDNDYPALCGGCEKSNGVCGYSLDAGKPFTCNCPGGVNTSTDCFYGQPAWSHGTTAFVVVPSRTWIMSAFFCVAWIILLTLT